MPPTRAIQCKYSCAKCGIHRQIVSVAARLPTEPDVVHWMDTVAAPALSRDHDARSPHCHITTLSEVMIPLVDGVDRVGGVE